MVRETVEAFGAGDLGRALSLIVEDVEWDNRGASAPGLDQVYLGHEGVMGLLTQIAEVFDEYAIVDPHYEASADRVLMVAREFGRGLSSGLGDHRPLAVVYTVRDGRIVRASAHSDVDEARRRFAAAG